jgi:hypothetical protein
MTEGLLAINTYTLYDLKAFKELKSQLEGRVEIFACDFPLLEYEDYFAELLACISFRGLIVDTAYPPVVCLWRGGKYEAVRRDPMLVDGPSSSIFAVGSQGSALLDSCPTLSD